MKRVATIVLNRNLPNETDCLYEHLEKYDGHLTDIYVVEAGSDDEKLSKYTTWHADWPDARREGLRYSRGMNFGLSNLWLGDKFQQYDAFFLITNDTELEPRSTIGILSEVLDQHPQLGILSPCSRRWGERLLLEDLPTKYFWFIHNNAFLMRREFIESICNKGQPDYMNFMFDGENFRGYGVEHEIIAKAYANDWAAAITTQVWAGENESYLLEKADLIKTEPYEANLKLYVEEGSHWMRKKYGFNSHWSMQQYVKGFYDQFFQFHPELIAYKL
jgi:hypothetical protein